MKRVYFTEDTAGDDTLHMFQWVRAVTKRYDGLGSRLTMDLSSMVSGLFYPSNATNPDSEAA